MKIKTLKNRLEKIGSKLENNNTFKIVSSRSGREFIIKVLKNHDSDEFFALALKQEGGDIMFKNMNQLTKYIFN